MSSQLQLMRSFLFVPGNRSDRYEKAATSGCDVMVVDLEDAVASESKDEAREQALHYFEVSDSSRVKRYLRINSPKTIHGLKDILALSSCKASPDGLVLPMLDSPEEVAWVDDLLGQQHSALRYLVVVETALGLENIESIVLSSDRIDAVGFGSADFTAQTGSDLSWDSLLYARSRIVTAAGMASILAIDGVWPDIKDGKGLVDETTRVAALGFSGKIAIHPDQISGIHAAFAPSSEALARAKEIVEAYEAARGGVVKVQGRMIDEPLVISARRTIAIGDVADN